MCGESMHAISIAQFLHCIEKRSSNRGLLACELVSFAALLHKLYFIIFTAMLRFLSWLLRDHLSYLNTLRMIGSTYLAYMFHSLVCDVLYVFYNLQSIELPDLNT